MLSEIILIEVNTANKIKSTAKNIFSLTNNNLGENKFIKIR